MRHKHQTACKNSLQKPELSGQRDRTAPEPCIHLEHSRAFPSQLIGAWAAQHSRRPMEIFTFLFALMQTAMPIARILSRRSLQTGALLCVLDRQILRSVRVLDLRYRQLADAWPRHNHRTLQG